MLVMDFHDKSLPSQRDKKTGHIYKLQKRLERKIDEEYDAEQAKIPIKVESASEDELEFEEPLLTSLKMTCSDNEDPFEGVAGSGSVVPPVSNRTKNVPETTLMSSVFGLRTDSPPNDLTAGKILNMFSMISKQIAEMNKKSDRIEKVVANMSDRLGRVEKKVGISLATLEQVKDSMVLTEEASRPENSNQNTDSATEDNALPAIHFYFKAISDKEELAAFDTKLGTDDEYYANVRRWLTRQIHVNDPDNRMHIAMDLVFERTFLALCSWTGNGIPAPKIPIRTRTNIKKLFADIGSTKYFTANELSVQRFFLKKLRYAKHRIHLKNIAGSRCHKRKLNQY